MAVGNSLRRGRAGARGPHRHWSVMHALGQRHRSDGPWHPPGRDVLLGGQVRAAPEVKDLPQLVRALRVLWSAPSFLPCPLLDCEPRDRLPPGGSRRPGAVCPAPSEQRWFYPGRCRAGRGPSGLSPGACGFPVALTVRLRRCPGAPPPLPCTGGSWPQRARSRLESRREARVSPHPVSSSGWEMEAPSGQ